MALFSVSPSSSLLLVATASMALLSAPTRAATIENGATQAETPAKTAADGKEDSREDKVASAVAFATNLTEEATAALTNEEADAETQLADFQAVLTEGLAIDAIGKIMLGKSRKTMSEEQLARYENVFPGYITKQYAEQFQEIIGRPLSVVDAKAVGRKDVVVRTQFFRDDGNPLNVDWRVRSLKSGDRKAIDIIVGGVSIMLVKREEFSSFIAQNGVDQLIERLEQETAA